MDAEMMKKFFMFLNLMDIQMQDDETWNLTVEVVVLFYMVLVCHLSGTRANRNILGSDPNRAIVTHNFRVENLNRLIAISDIACIDQLRMDRRTFNVLCTMLRDEAGLYGSNEVSLEEMVAMFLHTLAHHVKNMVIKFRFCRSSETVSKCFHYVLDGVIRLQKLLLKAPDAVSENSTDHKWKWFKNCLGALDGTYIPVRVAAIEKPRYRTRKSDIATNVLGVCSQNMIFIYTLVGWEGSAADSRVLRDALRCDRTDRFNVPDGYYYLVDAGYPNGNGFLAPFRGQRYHLNDWKKGHQPTSPEEFFNMKHSSARNVIERTYGLLKMRWACLRSATFYPIKTQGRLILACCLLHNLIRREMSVDPLEASLNDVNLSQLVQGDPIPYVEVTEEWTDFRSNLANEMYNKWLASKK